MLKMVRNEWGCNLLLFYNKLIDLQVTTRIHVVGELWKPDKVDEREVEEIIIEIR